MFYYSIKSRKNIVHFENCHHIKNIKIENLKTFDNIFDVRKSDYIVCSCCSPLVAQLKKEQSNLENYSLKNGLLFFMNKGILNIRTSDSKWKVLVSDNKNILELHHENKYELEHDDSVIGYHKQYCTSDSLLGYLIYINEHEYYRMLNPLKSRKKKQPPRKGTKRWNSQQRRLKKKERKQKICNVLNLIDSLSSNNKCAINA